MLWHCYSPFIWIFSLDFHSTGTCVSYPCQNGGTCTGDAFSYTCECPPLYIGNRCETLGKYFNNECYPSTGLIVAKMSLMSLLLVSSEIKVVSITLIEDARTKRESSHIGCKLRKMAKTLCLCLYFTHSSCVFQCLLHMLWTSVYYETYTDSRNLSPVAETDTNSIFKILWLNPLLVLGSSISKETSIHGSQTSCRLDWVFEY